MDFATMLMLLHLIVRIMTFKRRRDLDQLVGKSPRKKRKHVDGLVFFNCIIGHTVVWFITFVIQHNLNLEIDVIKKYLVPEGNSATEFDRSIFKVRRFSKRYDDSIFEFQPQCFSNLQVFYTLNFSGDNTENTNYGSYTWRLLSFEDYDGPLSAILLAREGYFADGDQRIRCCRCQRLYPAQNLNSDVSVSLLVSVTSCPCNIDGHHDAVSNTNGVNDQADVILFDVNDDTVGDVYLPAPDLPFETSDGALGDADENEEQYPSAQYGGFNQLHATVHDRSVTFDGLSTISSATVSRLAGLGLYYSGEADILLCVSCDVELHAWEFTESELLQQHQHCSSQQSQCVSVAGGENQINEEETQLEDSLDLALLQEENEVLELQLSCCVCRRRPREYMFHPCCHFVCCDICSFVVSTCPVCDSMIRCIFRVYLS